MRIPGRGARVARFAEEYAKHTALNLGQALQGLRYLYSHPRVDAQAPRGSLAHVARSLRLRARLVANDLFFAAIPPHWHHTREELSVMCDVPIERWFQYGYCAWRFDETGKVKQDLTGVDRRWDPRCDDEAPG
jgi:hypothetical protein